MPGLRGLLTLAVAVVVVEALYYGREVFIPLVLAVLLSFVLGPVVNLLRKARIGRVPSSSSPCSSHSWSSAASGPSSAPRSRVSRATFRNTKPPCRGISPACRRDGWGRPTGSSPSSAARSRTRLGNPMPPPRCLRPAGDGPQAQLVRIQEPEISPLALAEKVLGPVFEPLTTVGIVLVVVVFLLLQREDLRNRMIRLFGSRDLHRTTVAMDDAARRLGTYFLAQLGMNAAFGVIVGVGLWFIDVPNPLLWGVFSALMRFVPYIGAFIAGIFPVALAAAVDPGWSMGHRHRRLVPHRRAAVRAGGGAAALRPFHGLSPFAVIVSTLFWGFLWGPIGLILATPFTVCLVVLGRHVDSLEFLDIRLGDRAPLTPVENFYQRMLAGDPDEVRELAEGMLKDRSLSSYYDEVALKGLQLAANDYARGVVTATQLENIRSSSRSLVEDFEDHEDAEPTRRDGTAVSPSSNTNSMPPTSRAARTAAKLSGRGTFGRASASSRCIVEAEMPDRCANSLTDHRACRGRREPAPQ